MFSFALVTANSQQISIVLGEYVTDISESAEDTGGLKELVTTEDEKLVIPGAWKVEVTEGYVTAVEGDGKEL